MPFNKTTAVTLMLALLLVFAARPAVVARDARAGTSTDKSRAALDAWLARIEGSDEGRIARLDDPSIPKVFGSDRFYSVSFPRYPRAQLVPRPLNHENLFVVKPDGTVEHLPDLDALKKFLHDRLPAVRDDAHARNAAIASLHLAEVFSQDGYFHFTIREGAISVVHRNDHLIVSGKSEVTKGGRGGVTCSLTFQATGKVHDIELKERIRPDARPR